jgi:anti-sigma B factor antagonist
MVTEGQFDDMLRAFQDSGATDIEVDLRFVTFLDSSGLGLLARLRQASRLRGGSVTLLAPPSQVLRTLRLVGFDRIFSITEPRPPHR